MPAVSQSAQATLEKLFAGMKPGDHKKLGKDGGPIMALHCERLTEDTYSIAHYYTQNGDAVADPDVEFWRSSDGKFFPTNMTQPLRYTECRIGNGEGGPRFNERAQADIADFCTTWMENIRQYHDLT